ncbi:bile acid:sodium symporter family protein [bacterium]|nr:bile acid:sodium symporter family protein [bacterium]
MIRALNLLANLFPVWVVAAGGLALLEPKWFAWFGGNWITWGLAVIMLGMGVTLTFEDFRRVARRPGLVAIGFVAQFLIMPSLGWSLAKIFHLEPAPAVGLILVSCCPGGTASNVVTYIARADVALSVLMTMCSTFGAVIMTPTLTTWLAGSYVPVDFWGLLLGTLKVVIAPVIIGVLLNHFTPRLVRAINPVAPLVSVIFIALICGGIIARNAGPLKETAGVLFAAVTLLHVGGFGLGYLFAKACRCHQTARQTISIEVGMQNSGLGAALAQKNFAALPAATLPAAISATLHSVIGSLLAVYWRRGNGSNSPIEAPKAN